MPDGAQTTSFETEAAARLAARDAERKRQNREAAQMATEIGGGLKTVGKVAQYFVMASAVFFVGLALYTAMTTGG